VVNPSPVTTDGSIGLRPWPQAATMIRIMAPEALWLNDAVSMSFHLPNLTPILEKTLGPSDPDNDNQGRDQAEQERPSGELFY
jgi:hypothetical protein